jgi:uncharacterized LabA/DUF88 family protein
MIKDLKLGRVFVCIDAANIIYSQKSLGWKIDYGRLKDYFEKECNLVEIHLYIGQLDSDKKQSDLILNLERLGYKVTTKEVKRIWLRNGSSELKGNLDVELTIGILEHIDSFDALILLSGDGDFAAVLDRVKAQKKRVIVMSTKGHVAKELLERAKYIDLKKLKDRISI